MADIFLNALKGKVALITGASGGIGAATAREFAKQGVRLSLHGRNVEKLTQIQQQCVELGLKSEDAIIAVGELTNVDDVSKIAAATLKHFGTIDILINNAGSYINATLDSVTFDMMDTMFHLDVKAPLQLVKLFKEELIKNRGAIVNISGMLSIAGADSSYAAGITKAAMNQLTANLNIDLGPKGVRCNTICPGVVDNECSMKRDKSMTKEDAKQLVDQLSKLTLAGRPAENEEIAQSILFLCSAPYVMGQTLVVDGGMLDARLLNCAHLLEARNKEN